MNAKDEAARGVFARLASWSHRHRWAALGLWVLVVVAVSAGSGAVGSDYRNDFTLPGTQSQRATDLLTRHGAMQAGDSVQIVVKAPGGLRAPAVERDLRAALDRVKGLPSVVAVRTPYEDAAAISRDGTIGYGTVTLSGKSEAVPKEDVRRIIDTARTAASGALQVEAGGDAARGAQESEGGAAEGAGMLAALVILVLLFGSLIAAALPLVTALFAVGSAMGLIVLASRVATVADFTPPIMMLVGLGVGVDYALLVFYRYRYELLAGAEPREATLRSLDSAGRTVFIAACTVIIALLGLVALGLGSLQGVALAVALTVLVTMLASLTLLPALLGVFGERIRRQVLKRDAKARARGREPGAGWRRLATAVQRRPVPVLLVSVLALLALSAPALGMRLGFADAGNDPAGQTTRKAYDLLAEGFGPGFNGPLIVVGEGDAAAGRRVQAAVSGADGVAAATPPIPSRDGGLFTVLVFPETAPQDEGTADLVHTLRADVLPEGVLVGGSTAATQDFADTVSGRLPLFVAIVVGLSALLLLVVFRSVLIPIKAALLNLLSIAAALGAITLVFQEGWFGVPPGPIEAFIPVMIFAIVFGLSMDYEVFLLARIHEEWTRTRDPVGAVREGLTATGQVITAAGAIMIVVFAAFVLSPSRMLQQFGLGLAVAILLDAVVIRCLIVPAVLRLFGRRAWWLPAPLARWLPEVSLERPETPREPARTG
ncbi:MMPL family transporter [Actinomadura viridis]|uniref:RND superfamily putative drug exporter n=1 Tax=Actinomadura viridis TaxID=58110 RepID=A0A931DGE3_9ACTN|nr:MMPL family transporter [Actinomadura viridis]MBG6088314.1 RND superfamily putative drug exporter [Actinomadura viridis]